METQLEQVNVRAQKELILLHKEDADTPKGTIEWLNARGWLTTHHHIKCPKRVFSRKSREEQVRLCENLLRFYKKIYCVLDCCNNTVTPEHP